MGPIDNVLALFQIIVDVKQPASHYLNPCWPSSLTHICVTHPWCVNMIKKYDNNIDTNFYMDCTKLQVIVFVMKINVVVIIWRNVDVSSTSMAVVCPRV